MWNTFLFAGLLFKSNWRCFFFLQYNCIRCDLKNGIWTNYSRYLNLLYLNTRFFSILLFTYRSTYFQAIWGAAVKERTLQCWLVYECDKGLSRRLLFPYGVLQSCGNYFSWSSLEKKRWDLFGARQNSFDPGQQCAVHAYTNGLARYN